jgi:PncC family amidohydrolase
MTTPALRAICRLAEASVSLTGGIIAVGEATPALAAGRIIPLKRLRSITHLEVVMDQPWEVKVATALRAQAWTLAVAESCTGGLVGHLVTDVPGSSDYFLGGVICYANEVKRDVVGVPAETLEAFGAVSRETAVALARGVRRALGADVGLAVTGIAGPGGGTPDKPVGLTWLALVTPEGEIVERDVWTGDRQAVKAQSARAALALLWRALQGEA